MPPFGGIQCVPLAANYDSDDDTKVFTGKDKYQPCQPYQPLGFGACGCNDKYNVHDLDDESQDWHTPVLDNRNQETSQQENEEDESSFIHDYCSCDNLTSFFLQFKPSLDGSSRKGDERTVVTAKTNMATASVFPNGIDNYDDDGNVIPMAEPIPLMEHIKKRHRNHHDKNVSRYRNSSRNQVKLISMNSKCDPPTGKVGISKKSYNILVKKNDDDSTLSSITIPERERRYFEMKDAVESAKLVLHEKDGDYSAVTSADTLNHNKNSRGNNSSDPNTKKRGLKKLFGLSKKK